MNGQPAAAHPSADKRFKLLETTMKRLNCEQHALIEVLHAAQQLFGYLERDLLYFITRQLKLPPSKVWGVATFYHFFRLKPTGEHTCVVCTRTACYVKGADALIAAVEKEAHAKVGETTAKLVTISGLPDDVYGKRKQELLEMKKAYEGLFE
jgi:bidirectional [NiFe] hydrogenase diaphorase subunit